MRAQAVTDVGLIDHVVRLVTSRGAAHRLRVLVDGSPPTRPGDLADALVGPLRAAGRPMFDG
jgi:hypothetical protein